MEYINLIDYLDKPELIQHNESGGGVRSIHHFPDKPKKNVLVVFSDYSTEWYHESGQYEQGGRSCFFLKPKPKKTITGWRRGIFYNNSGCFAISPIFHPTKEEFKKAHKGCTLFGPWESETIEIDED